MVAYSFYEADNRVRRYAEALVRRGDTVDVIGLSHPDREDKKEINGVNVYNIQKRKLNERTKFDYLFRTTLFLFQSFLFLTMRHIKNPYKLIHVHSVPDYEVFAAIVAKILGAKIILDIHDIVPEFYAGKFSSNKTGVIFRALVFIEKLCCSFSNHVIISNHIWADKLTKRSVKEEKCLTLLNFPDPFIFYNRLLEKRNSTPFTLIYPGTLNWHQGLDIAIEAMDIVKKRALPAELHIYGRGPEEQNLKNLALSLDLSTHVKFHGILSLEEVAQRMAFADSGLVPKRADGFGNEAFSTKIFEFMALGVPVIVSKTRIDEYYFNDSLVLFFAPGNAYDLAEKISACVKDRQLVLTRAQNAAPFIRENTWDVKQSLYFNLVDSLVAS